MAANDPTVLYEAAWGDIRLFLADLTWEAGNTQVIHDLAAGDDHPMQPRGMRLQTATVKLIFDDFPDARETGVAAFRRLEAASKERRIFTHPVAGSFYARIGKMTPTVDESSVITVEAEIIPDTGADPVSPIGAATTVTAGVSAVAAAAAKLEHQLAASQIGFPTSALARANFQANLRANVTVMFSANVNLGVSANLSASVSASAAATATAAGSASATAAASAVAFADVYAQAFATAQITALADATAMGSASAFAYAYAAAAITADARATVDAWAADPALSLRTVQIDSARLSQSIADLITIGELELHLELWPCFTAAILLGDAVRSAAIAATADTPRVFTVIVRARTSLLPLAAKIYGGAAARDRAAQIIDLNDIKTPAWLDPGVYLAPVRDPAALPTLSVSDAR